MTEAKEIKERIATFLGTELKLTLSADKTLITHANTGRARFLGYEIDVMEAPTKFDYLVGTNIFPLLRGCRRPASRCILRPSPPL